MGLRWYSIVIDCHDLAAQARWWAEALHWNLIFENEEEAAVVPSWMTADPVPADRWDRELPGLVFVSVPEDKTTKNRLHLDLATHLDDDRDAEIARLTGLGARIIDVGQQPDATWTVLADPEGNEFCVLSARNR